MLIKESCLEKYEEFKRSRNGEIPQKDEFLKYAHISEGQLECLFGKCPYSKLQTAAGDAPNKWELKRTPLATIMTQYGNLVIELGELPVYAEWHERGLKPTKSGLKKVHQLNWSELPEKFVEWATTEKISGFSKAIEILNASGQTSTPKRQNCDVDFSRLIDDVRNWTPARRRNSEETYKVELRKHLESLKHEVNEEFGESKYDLLVRRKYAIELKKEPDLAEYDRLFGQLARHLQHQRKVIVLILDAKRNDPFGNFTSLVDEYFNVGENSVEVIKK